MEIGPISEWVAVISEFLAVCVALFLPYYNQRKEQKRKIRNLRISIKALTDQALDGDKYAMRTLELYINISFLSSANAKMDQLVVQGRQIVNLLKQLPDKSAADYQDRADEIRSQVQQTAA